MPGMQYPSILGPWAHTANQQNAKPPSNLCCTLASADSGHELTSRYLHSPPPFLCNPKVCGLWAAKRALLLTSQGRTSAHFCRSPPVPNTVEDFSLQPMSEPDDAPAVEDSPHMVPVADRGYLFRQPASTEGSIFQASGNLSTCSSRW